MKKTLSLLVVFVLIATLFVSCASQKEVRVKGSKIIGAEGVAQPEWVVKVPKSETLYYETGYAKLANKANSIKRANAEGKEKISQWISTTVENVVVNYTSDMGSEGDRLALESFESISRQTSQTALVGVSQESVWVDQDGGVWVLLSMPKENIVKAFDIANNEFKQSDAALYAEYKMDQALKMLDDTLKKL